jgi:hypothetical protein
MSVSLFGLFTSDHRSISSLAMLAPYVDKGSLAGKRIITCRLSFVRYTSGKVN